MAQASSTDHDLRLVFGGDAMLARGVSRWIEAHPARDPLGALHKFTRGADLFAVNLECAITARQAKFEGAPKVFYFRAIPQAMETLTAAGVDLVSLANNHALDAGVEGLKDTLQALSDARIRAVGAGTSLEEASRPILLERGDLTLGFVACCDHQADFAATESRAGIWYLDLWNEDGARPLLDGVAALADQADLTIVAPHWQPNWAPEVRPDVRRLARDLVAAGADLIWGHSPHHFQGVEWIDATPCLYATGDLVDDYAVDPSHRNDRQLLFEASVQQGVVRAVHALPLKLEFAQTELAGGEDFRWIQRRFDSMCEQVGSQVQEEAGWLEVLPA